MEEEGVKDALTENKIGENGKRGENGEKLEREEEERQRERGEGMV